VKGQPGMPRHPRTASLIADNIYCDRTGITKRILINFTPQVAGCPANGGIDQARVNYVSAKGGFQQVRWWIAVIGGQEFAWCATRNLALEILWLESIERMVASDSLSATQ
jgi:hypothetical protein